VERSSPFFTPKIVSAQRKKPSLNLQRGNLAEMSIPRGVVKEVKAWAKDFPKTDMW
jgi:hypothetical protein